MKNIGDRVKQRMADLGIKDQNALAKRCGTTQASINRLINNKTDSPEYIWELSQALVTSVQWLKTGIEDKSLEFMLKYKPLVDAYEAAPSNIRESVNLQLGLEGAKKISPKNGLSNGRKGAA